MWPLESLHLGLRLTGYFYWLVLLDRAYCVSVPAFYKRPRSRTRRELSSQLMVAGCDSPNKGHAPLRLISAAGTRTPSIQQPSLLHRRTAKLRISELGAQTWSLKQVTNLLCFLTCEMEIILPASWGYFGG